MAVRLLALIALGGASELVGFELADSVASTHTAEHPTPESSGKTLVDARAFLASTRDPGPSPNTVPFVYDNGRASDVPTEAASIPRTGIPVFTRPFLQQISYSPTGPPLR